MQTSDQMPIWVVYKHPSDFPDHYVVRCHRFCCKTHKTIQDKDVMLSRDYAPIAQYLDAMGLVKLDRMPEDDPIILETWL